MSYFNTTHQSGAQLQLFSETAGKQNRLVYDFFMKHPGAYSPSDVHKDVLQSSPLTSVRRAITVLTKAGLIKKTNAFKIGPYGRPEYLWKLNN